jgi:CheY-like chemotaxis protein
MTPARIMIIDDAGKQLFSIQGDLDGDVWEAIEAIRDALEAEGAAVDIRTDGGDL